MSDEVERVVARVRNSVILVVGVVARGMLRRTVLVIIAVACEVTCVFGSQVARCWDE